MALSGYTHKPYFYPPMRIYLYKALSVILARWSELLYVHDPISGFFEAVQDVDTTRSAGCTEHIDDLVTSTKGDALKKHQLYYEQTLNKFLATAQLPDVHWRTFGKSQIMPSEKKGLKERSIVNAPLEIYICARSLLGRQLVRFYENWKTLPPKVGMSKFYGQYEFVFRQMKRKTHCISVDIQGQEFNFSQPYFEVIRTMRAALLPRQFSEHVATLYDKLQKCSFEDPLGRLYAKESLNCSGHPSTVDDNSLFSWIFVYAYYIRHRGNVDPFDHIELAVYGDNIMIGFNEDDLDLFEPERFIAQALQFAVPLKLEGYSAQGPYGLPFLSMTFDGKEIHSERPEQILSRLFYVPENVEQSIAVLESLYNELYLDKEMRELLEDYARDLKRRGYFPRLLDRFQLSVMYNVAPPGRPEGGFKSN